MKADTSHGFSCAPPMTASQVAVTEMAQAYRRLGAHEVTIVEMADRILGPYEP
jgi:hypothetical protein